MFRPRPTLLAATLVVGSAMVASAQANRNASTQAPPNPSAPSSIDNTKRAMTVADYAKWRTIRDVAITDDGQWVSYGYQQRNVDDTLYVKSLVVGTEQKIPRGSRSQFSDDGKWIAYFVANPSRGNSEQAPGGGEGGPAPAGPAKLELRNLASNAVVSWDNVASFAFSKGSNAMIIRKARAGAGPAAAPTGGRGGGGGRGGTRPPRNAAITNFAWGIEPWDTETVRSELLKRGLTPREDTGNRGSMETSPFKSFHVRDPDGWDLQISNQTKEKHEL